MRKPTRIVDANIVDNVQHHKIEVPEGLMTQARAGRFKEQLNLFLKSFLHEDQSHVQESRPKCVQIIQAIARQSNQAIKCSWEIFNDNLLCNFYLLCLSVNLESFGTFLHQLGLFGVGNPSHSRSIATLQPIRTGLCAFQPSLHQLVTECQSIATCRPTDRTLRRSSAQF